jgi:hypothetical protein
MTIAEVIAFFFICVGRPSIIGSTTSAVISALSFIEKLHAVIAGTTAMISPLAFHAIGLPVTPGLTIFLVSREHNSRDG